MTILAPIELNEEGIQMPKKLQVGKPISLKQIQGATVPDGVARVGNIDLIDDQLTYAIHYYHTAEEAEAGGEPFARDTFTMTDSSLENKILAHAKQQSELDSATDI